jgi:hypothetical protein
MGMGASAPIALLLIFCFLGFANVVRSHSARRLLIVERVELDTTGECTRTASVPCSNAHCTHHSSSVWH